jgi:ligand-binding SRPBCC domain-containing protein
MNMRDTMFSGGANHTTKVASHTVVIDNGTYVRTCLSSGCAHTTVTWQAKHLYKVRKIKTKITSMNFPDHFIVQMVHGDFKSFRHEHHFKPIDNGTFLIDIIEFESPYGIIGQLANQLFLTSYLHQLLLHRNEVIKQYAESSKWKAILI